MRRSLMTMWILTGACNETGEFTIVSASGIVNTDTESPTDNPLDAIDTDAPQSDDTDASPPDEPPPAPPVTADNCGVYEAPDPASIDQETTTSAGEATLRSQGGFNWSWEGCQADRVFDAQGAFVCETVFSVSGALQGGFSWTGPDFVYDLTFAVDRASTTCPNAQDESWSIGFDLGFDAFGGAVTLQRTALGTDNWRAFADSAYEANRNFDQITLEYSTGF